MRLDIDPTLVFVVGAGLLLLGLGALARRGADEVAKGRTLVERVLEANRRYLAAPPPAPPLPHKPRLGWAIVACMDARLTDLLPRALGFGRGDAVMIRTAGHDILEGDRAVLRSLAVACHFQDVREVAVIGHSGCGMRRRAADVRAAGLDPAWLGSFEGTIEEHVRETVAGIVRCAGLPAGVKVYGLVIETDRGGLRYICEETTRG